MPESPPARGEDGDTLTAEDEKVLDEVAKRITPEQLARSKRFLARIAEAKKGKE